MSHHEPPDEATFPVRLPADITDLLDVQFVPHQYYVSAIAPATSHEPHIVFALWLYVVQNESHGVAVSSVYLAEWSRPSGTGLAKLTEYVPIQRLSSTDYVVRKERDVPIDSRLATYLVACVEDAGYFRR